MQRVISTFEAYQKARVAFVQNVAQLATREQNADLMENAGVLRLLKPLLHDNVPSVQQTAAVAIGRLASHNENVARDVVEEGILTDLVVSLGSENAYARKASAFVLRSVAKHSVELATTITKENGTIEALKSCLDDIDPAVKEAGVWAVDYIARHNRELAKTVAGHAGMVKSIVLCLEEPEQSLKRVAACALCDIAKHSAALAQQVVDAKALVSFDVLLNADDVKLQQHVCASVAQIVKHSEALCDQVVKTGVLRRVLLCVRSSNAAVRHNAMICVRETAKRSEKQCDAIVQDGGVKTILDVVQEHRHSSVCLPGAMALGHIASFSESNASKIYNLRGTRILQNILVDAETGNETRAAVAWSLGHIASHSTKLGDAMCNESILHDLIAIYLDNKGTVDVKRRSREASKMLISNCTAIDKLRYAMDEKDDSLKLKKYTLQRFKKLLPENFKLKREFVESGMLRVIQELEGKPGGGTSAEDQAISELIQDVKKCFPAALVQSQSSRYGEELLNRFFGHA